MKTIKKIFWTDVKNLAKNMFALIIAVGVCFLPALYAWFNIYSNWDPYGNTGSLQLAAVSLDEGFTTDLEHRVKAHNDRKGDKYTKTRTPVRLVYYEQFETKQLAMQREAAIKKLSRKEKLQLIEAREHYENN